jgi:hypothetical protein
MNPDSLNEDRKAVIVALKEGITNAGQRSGAPEAARALEKIAEQIDTETSANRVATAAVQAERKHSIEFKLPDGGETFAYVTEDRLITVPLSKDTISNVAFVISSGLSFLGLVAAVTVILVSVFGA